MAASNPHPHPLDVLDQMFKEVLVQAGKHLKANNKDGPRNTAGASTTARAKTTDSLAAYHYALDDLESEITRAKAVVLRDLEKLRAARAPPAPAPQPVAPPAPMMELPSSAAHTMSAPAFAPKQEPKTAAPFPDMGMGMSADVVDLTSSEKKPSPRVPPGAIRPPTRVSPQMVKNEMKASPKQTFKPAPKPTPPPPPKVTPVPVPQIPRPHGHHPPQPSSIGPGAAGQSQSAAANAQANRQSQATPAAQAAQDASLNAMLMPANASGGETNAATGGTGLNFTDMQFAPPSTEAPGAPPAPMPEFDLATFAPQDSGNDMMSLDTKPNNATSGQNTTAPQQPQKEEEKPDTNLDDLFSLDDSNNGTDGMFDLGGGMNDSTFDDMMYFDNNDNDMAQFDENYFIN
ncbi:hypothetical protein F5Y13DRAFT_171796 [Hypoxylon sp. FL1857]|nr:hypothetical protein F5Y13DRAFT_171796 [Hypoxylon sp. FL1857]